MLSRITTWVVTLQQQVLRDSWEFDKPTTCFIDLRKADGTANRSALRGIARPGGILEKRQRLISDLYTGTQPRARAYVKKSSQGVRQVCILGPALLNVFLDHVLHVVLNESEGGIKIKHTIDGDIRTRTLVEA